MDTRRKREIVRRFMAGKSVEEIAYALVCAPEYVRHRNFITEQILRDYMAGKFSMDTKTRKARLP